MSQAMDDTHCGHEPGLLEFWKQKKSQGKVDKGRAEIEIRKR